MLDILDIDNIKPDIMIIMRRDEMIEMMSHNVLL